MPAQTSPEQAAGRLPGTSFRLLPEPGEATTSALEPLVVSGGVVGLAGVGREIPYFVVAGGPECRVLLEQVTRLGVHRLLAVAPAGALRCNDLKAPHAVLLQHGDQFSVAGGIVLEVAEFIQPHVGPPPRELIGKACPTCRVPFGEETRLYRCSWCGSGMHLEEGDESVALQCARLVPECPVCRHPVHLGAGYRSRPQFLEQEHV